MEPDALAEMKIRSALKGLGIQAGCVLWNESTHLRDCSNWQNF